MSDERLTAADYHKVVTETSAALWDALHERVNAALPETRPDLRWLISGRIVSVMFQRHFRLAYTTADEQVQLGAEPKPPAAGAPS